jgi:hypothetical protein
MRVLELEADSREAMPRKGARSTSTNALEVEQAYPRGWNSTSTTSRIAAMKGAARFGGAYIRLTAARETR